MVCGCQCFSLPARRCAAMSVLGWRAPALPFFMLVLPHYPDVISDATFQPVPFHKQRRHTQTAASHPASYPKLLPVWAQIRRNLVFLRFALSLLFSFVFGRSGFGTLALGLWVFLRGTFSPASKTKDASSTLPYDRLAVRLNTRCSELSLALCATGSSFFLLITLLSQTASLRF